MCSWIADSTILLLQILVLILVLLAEKMLDGFDLFYSYCKRFDGYYSLDQINENVHTLGFFAAHSMH